MKRIIKFGFLTLMAGAGLMAGAHAAQAEPHGWHNGGPKYNQHDNRYNDRDDRRYDDHDRGGYYRRPVVINQWNTPRYVIRDRDRVVVRNYIGHTWRPGYSHYAPRYLIGAPLAYGVDYYPVPQHVLVQLAPVPRGYRYVRVDNDVLLLDATARVIDAIARL